LAIAPIAFGVSVLNSKAGHDLQTCLHDAGSNQAQIQHFDKQFAKHVTGG
jgi:hypothetical protein